MVIFMFFIVGMLSVGGNIGMVGLLDCLVDDFMFDMDCKVEIE